MFLISSFCFLTKVFCQKINLNENNKDININSVINTPKFKKFFKLKILNLNNVSTF